ncbi:hypothetical protein ACFLRC_02235, partial [Candidatus Altiarchaeota archaeon]
MVDLRFRLGSHNKGQASVEYLVWIAPLLLLVAVLYANAMSDSVQTINFNKANDAVDRLTKAADTVYGMGPGSKVYTVISNPDGILDHSFSGHTIVYKMKMPREGVADVVGVTRGQIKGFIPKDSRSFKVPVRMLDSGVIMVGWGMLMEPSEIYMVVPAGEISNESSLNLTNERVNLTNTLDDTVDGIVCNVSGEIGFWSWWFQGHPPWTLPPGESSDFGLVFQVEENQSAGLYYGAMICESNDSRAETPITIEVPQDFTRLEVKTFSDGDFSVPETIFNQTLPVYFEVKFWDHADELMSVDQFNITVSNESEIQRNYTNLSVSSGVYQNN